jgi:cysteinyl-tRNA synthetase
MSSDILGGEFDIHGGGIDLIFPHHENEIAQSEGAGKRFARCWMHNGLLTIKGEKMAKSLGNFISIKAFLAAHADPDYLKLLFLNTHYRHPVDYTEEKIDEMKAQKERFIILFEKVGRALSAAPANRGEARGRQTLLTGRLAEFRQQFEGAMDDDFNTPLALAALFDIVTYVNRAAQEAPADAPALLASAGATLTELGAVLGLELSRQAAGNGIGEREVLEAIAKRDAARLRKDFKAADEIRGSLLRDHGIILEDTKDGTVWRRHI